MSWGGFAVQAAVLPGRLPPCLCASDTCAAALCAGTFVAQGGMGDGSVDNLRVLGYDTSLAGQQYTLQPGSAKTFSLQLVAPTRASIG